MSMNSENQNYILKTIYVLMGPCFAHVMPDLQNCRYKPKINVIGQNLDLCYDIQCVRKIMEGL